MRFQTLFQTVLLGFSISNVSAVHPMMPRSLLSGRQSSGCPVNFKVCGATNCIPTEDTCCAGGNGGCPPGYRCDGDGCCEIGKVCGGPALSCPRGRKMCLGNCVPTDFDCTSDPLGGGSSSSGGGSSSSGGGSSSSGGGSSSSDPEPAPSNPASNPTPTSSTGSGTGSGSGSNLGSEPSGTSSTGTGSGSGIGSGSGSNDSGSSSSSGLGSGISQPSETPSSGGSLSGGGNLSGGGGSSTPSPTALPNGASSTAFGRGLLLAVCVIAGGFIMA